MAIKDKNSRDAFFTEQCYLCAQERIGSVRESKAAKTMFYTRWNKCGQISCRDNTKQARHRL